MLINTICNTPKIYDQKPAYVSFTKKQNKVQVDTFEKQREPYNVGNSIDDFSYELYELLRWKYSNQDEIRDLMRKYVPGTKLRDDTKEPDANNATAIFKHKYKISKDGKIHYIKKKIVLDMDKKEDKKPNFYNDVVHEMTHNLQVNKEKRIVNKVFNDYFSDNFENKKFFCALFYTAYNHGSALVSDAFSESKIYYGIADKIRYNKRRNANVENLLKNYTSNITKEDRKEIRQMYDIGVLTLLKNEKEAYGIAHERASKYYPDAKNNTWLIYQLLNPLCSFVLNDLKHSGISTEKYQEYVDMLDSD